MSVLEMQSQSRPAVRWTEVCATEHSAVNLGATEHSAVNLGATEHSAVNLGATELGAPATTRVRPRDGSERGLTIRTLDRGRRVPTRSIGPGRLSPVRPASAGQVTACRVAAKPASPVVDDVPTWVLLACGIVFGVVMLLALALLGGPAYA
ncbi:hypothetical protein [Rhodococcus sp. IEGM 1408]|uniref:hypothetical protein n=1 Tax=Rhodococcus sp. IEGM 1408 TaxID=3082220 RepID=UPI002952D82F|nr:hypothetical protein [Rhodococcus sp. IEGM 1408]MDV8000388.1 hypothetical protein [Rhodococcus sp. IEGM 1408]